MSNYESLSGRSPSAPRPEILLAPGLISRSATAGHGNAALSTYVAGPGQEASENVGGGSGLSRYIHALRRRWLVSLVIAMPLAGGAAYGAWALQPQMYSSTAVLELRSDDNPFVFMTADQTRGGGGTTFDSFKRSQKVRLRQRQLIEEVLSLPEHKDLVLLPVLRREAPREIAWLEKNLSVTFQDNSDVMHVSLTADDPKGLDKIVNAIVDQYLEAVVGYERKKKMERYSSLEKASKDADDDLRKKRNELKQLVERVGHSEKTSLSIVQQAALHQYQAFVQRSATIKSEWLQEKTELDHRLELQEKQDDEILISESELAAAVLADPVARVLDHEKESTISQIEKHRGVVQGGRADEALKAATSKLEANAKKRELRQIEVRKLLVERIRLAASSDIELLKQKVASLKKQCERFDEEAEKLEKKAREVSQSSIEVEMRQADLSVLEAIANNLRTEFAKTKVETKGNGANNDESWARIRKAYSASIARPVDSKTRITTTIGVGGISFVLPFVLFVVLDASKNRISTGAEVTQAVGLSVIGAVPILPQRVMRRLNGPSESDKYWRTMLSESVDSIAAVLLKGTQPGASRVIMVSSANAGEGKTTLASHLAVSLAGAGRHPVLVDFDLRRPALHRVFGVSLQPGVNEILRDGHEFESALQATQIPNLMMLSAGRTSKLGLGGLVAADLQSLFSKLRAEFDFVVVDACPILPVVDTRLIGQHVDAVLLSVLRDVSRAPKLRQACDLLDMFGIPMLGVVVTGSSEELYKDARYEPLSEAQAV